MFAHKCSYSYSDKSANNIAVVAAKLSAFCTTFVTAYYTALGGTFGAAKCASVYPTELCTVSAAFFGAE